MNTSNSSTRCSTQMAGAWFEELDLQNFVWPSHPDINIFNIFAENHGTSAIVFMNIIYYILCLRSKDDS
jgi:hypothetical protein